MIESPAGASAPENSTASSFSSDPSPSRTESAASNSPSSTFVDSTNPLEPSTATHARCHRKDETRRSDSMQKSNALFPFASHLLNLT